MSKTSAEDILDRLFRSEIGPIEAADELIASGQFMIGGIGLDTAAVPSEQVARFQAMLGRLTWTFLRSAGATNLPELKSSEEYRDFHLLTQHHASDET